MTTNAKRRATGQKYNGVSTIGRRRTVMAEGGRRRDENAVVVMVRMF
jgi:hypothetical protein